MSLAVLKFVLDNIHTGVLVFSPGGEIVLANKAALMILRLSEKNADRLPSVLSRQFIDAAGQGMIVCQGPGGRLLSCSLSPIPFFKDNEGGTNIMAMIEDVTEQVKMGAQRERANSLSAMGEMAAEVAHQIRNPLGGIELFTSLLGREIAGEESLERFIENIQGGVKEINHLITNYLALARPPRPVKTAVNIGRLLEEAISAATEVLEHNSIQTILGLNFQSAWVEADSELMLQVFLNIILNAVEAMASVNDRKNRLEITMKNEQRRVKIKFHDNGPGIGEKELARIFNPFFTTKDKNLGLGLAVSHRIIDAHGGLIQINSRLGLGAMVTITLNMMPAKQIPAKHLRS